jgi:hypothetical protein
MSKICLPRYQIFFGSSTNGHFACFTEKVKLEFYRGGNVDVAVFGVVRDKEITDVDVAGALTGGGTAITF